MAALSRILDSADLQQRAAVRIADHFKHLFRAPDRRPCARGGERDLPRDLLADIVHDRPGQREHHSHRSGVWGRSAAYDETCRRHDAFGRLRPGVDFGNRRSVVHPSAAPVSGHAARRLARFGDVYVAHLLMDADVVPVFGVYDVSARDGRFENAVLFFSPEHGALDHSNACVHPGLGRPAQDWNRRRLPSPDTSQMRPHS